MSSTATGWLQTSLAVVLEGGVPRVVDGDTFHTVQKLKASRDARKTKRSGRAYSSQWLLGRRQGRRPRLERERAVVRRLRADEVSGAEHREFMDDIDGELNGHPQRLHDLEQAVARVRVESDAKSVLEQLEAIDTFTRSARRSASIWSFASSSR